MFMRDYVFILEPPYIFLEYSNRFLEYSNGEGQTTNTPNGLGPQPNSRTQEKKMREHPLTADIN